MNAKVIQLVPRKDEREPDATIMFCVGIVCGILLMFGALVAFIELTRG